MTYGMAVLIVLAASLAAALVTAAIHWRVGLEMRRHHHEVGSVVFLQLGVVFAVLLAFVCDECLTEYNAAAEAIDLECGALHGASMLAATLPAAAARVVLQAERQYVLDVLQRDWPEMAARREGSPEARAQMTRMFLAAAKLRLDDAQDRGKQTQVLQLFSEAHAQRESRLFRAEFGIPVALWVVLLGLTSILVTFVSFSGIQYRGTAMAVAFIFAAGTVSILVVARLLDYPFEGSAALLPTDFTRALSNIDLLLQS